MEVKIWNERIKVWIGKYKYAMAVLLIGFLLLLTPSEKESPGKKAETERMEANIGTDLESELSDILSNVQGAGDVKVILTVSEGERTLYQTDITSSQTDTTTNTKTQTILITDSDRNQTGLIHQKNPPVYCGAIILAQGADEPKIKWAIVDAVGKATGLGADKISVLKMK